MNNIMIKKNKAVRKIFVCLIVLVAVIRKTCYSPLSKTCLICVPVIRRIAEQIKQVLDKGE